MTLRRPGKAGSRRRSTTTDLEMPSAAQPGRDLSILALMLGTGFALAAAWYDIYPLMASHAPLHRDPAQTASRLTAEIWFAGLCLAVGWYSRRSAPSPRPARLAATVLQLTAALLLSVPLGPTLLPTERPLAHGISWVCVLIVIFPLLIPGRARFHVLVALACATMWPLHQLLRVAFGRPVPPGTFVLDFSVPPFLCVGIVLMGARIMSRIRRTVREARSEAEAAREMARELGSYTLLRPLGRGGMGEVWVAEHRMLARPAAIKLIRPARTSGDAVTADDLLRRFEQEARATARLRSQHTVELYDFGRTDDGSFYYVMELLDGIDLEELVRRFGPQPPGRVALLLAQACLSLQEAHERGLIHRDIKPSNVFLCRHGSELDVVKILDFGLVQCGADAPDTGPRMLMGTPAYMPPECFSDAGTIDARSDLYSLGCVGYWLLTGRPAFEHAPMREMANRRLRQPPEAPARLAPDIPPELETAVMACLAPNPDERPRSASELRTRLLQCRFRRPWGAAEQESWWRQVPSFAAEEFTAGSATAVTMPMPGRITRSSDEATSPAAAPTDPQAPSRGESTAD